MLETLQVVESIVTILVVVIGGIWAFITLVLRREFSRRIEFSVDVAFIGVQEDYWVAEILAYMENKGNVRHKVTDFTFRVRYIKEDDKIEYGGRDINYQINFPTKLEEIDDNPRSWMHPRAQYTYVEPGIRQRYSYTLAIPREAKFVLVQGRFNSSVQ